MTTPSRPGLIITVTLSPALDVTYALPEGGGQDVDVFRASSSTLEASGKGVNVSRALHSVGVPTCAVLPAGGPAGRCLAELLDEEHVPHRIVAQDSSTRVNTTALRPGGETLKLNGPGATLTAGEQEALLDATRRALEGAAARVGETWVAVCGSLPRGTTADVVTRLVELAHAHGGKCAVDASGDALKAALEARADLLAPNRGELADVVDDGLRAGGLLDLGQALRSLSAETGSRLLVSVGREGALYTDGDDVLHGTAAPLTPVNTAGAGDALLAGWLSTVADRRSRLETAVRWGRSACLSVTTVDSRPGLRDTQAVTVSDLVTGKGQCRGR